MANSAGELGTYWLDLSVHDRAEIITAKTRSDNLKTSLHDVLDHYEATTTPNGSTRRREASAERKLKHPDSKD